MTVELIAKGDNCFDLGVANGTWWDLVHNTAIKKILKSPPNTHDDRSYTEAQALKCATTLKAWDPPLHWYGKGKEKRGKQIFMDFFNSCEGFTTS